MFQPRKQRWQLLVSISERMPRMTMTADEKSAVITREKRKGHRNGYKTITAILQKAYKLYCFYRDVVLKSLLHSYQANQGKKGV